ncbi:hypothetical protein FEM54_19350 [Pseudomonas edaphica]|uniref:Uncharacterized protein n=1 Tax=Pseudomonas edaphica TaxID=2006980 RepID=A0ABY2U226_9PSED|nr:hypothetical protein FEM54_19350 [Pseudomonas edaphica]
MGAGLCGSWLACDANTSVIQLNPGDAIAGKPAPTQSISHTSQFPQLSRCRLGVTRHPDA